MNDINRSPPEELITGPEVTPAWRRSLTTRRVLVVIAVLLAFALLAWLLTPKGGTKAPAGRFARRRTDAGGDRHRTHGRHADHAHRPRRRDAAGHGDGAEPDQRPDHAHLLQGGSDGQGRRSADPDRSATLPGGARAGARGARARQGAARQRAHRPGSLPDALRHRIPSPSSSSPRRSRWSRRTRATSRPTRARSMRRNSIWSTATSSRRSAGASVCSR